MLRLLYFTFQLLNLLEIMKNTRNLILSQKISIHRTAIQKNHKRQNRGPSDNMAFAQKAYE